MYITLHTKIIAHILVKVATPFLLPLVLLLAQLQNLANAGALVRIEKELHPRLALVRAAIHHAFAAALGRSVVDRGIA